MVKIKYEEQDALIHGDDYFLVDKRLTQEIVNEVGIRMLKYKYWVVKTKNAEYKITNPDEHNRIVKALCRYDVRFVHINGDMVNVIFIENIIEKTGYREIKKEE